VIIHPKDLKNREYVTLINMFDYICIDSVEQISNDKLLEEALFFWINEVKQSKKKIVLASQISNSDKNWQLADLRSRLSSGQTHQLLPLSRHGVLQVFDQQAKQKGFILDKKVIDYLEKNCSMNMIFLQELLKQLDKATLIHKKQVTIPLIKKILHTVLVK
jgi:DnaA family protein